MTYAQGGDMVENRSTAILVKRAPFQVCDRLREARFVQIPGLIDDVGIYSVRRITECVFAARRSHVSGSYGQGLGWLRSVPDRD